MQKRRPGWSVEEAKNRFSEVLKAAQKTPQLVTKHGKATAVVLSADEYERLRQIRKAEAPSLAELLLAMPQDGGDFPRMTARPRDVTP